LSSFIIIKNNHRLDKREGRLHRQKLCPAYSSSK